MYPVTPGTLMATALFDGSVSQLDCWIESYTVTNICLYVYVTQTSISTPQHYSVRLTLNVTMFRLWKGENCIHIEILSFTVFPIN